MTVGGLYTALSAKARQKRRYEDMKLVYEKMDEEHLEALRRNILYGDIPPGYPTKEKKTYFIPFDVLDIAKANVFINNFVHGNSYPRIKETEYLTGVKFGRVICSKKISRYHF